MSRPLPPPLDTDRRIGARLLRTLALAASLAILTISGMLYSEATYTPPVRTVDGWHGR